MKSASRLLFALVALCALDCAAQSVGRVLVAVGEVVATRGSRDIPLATGASLERGDTIRTGERSSAQLRFTDETIVAMREKSSFEVVDYRFTGTDDGVSQAVYNLVRGGLRTLHGLIGRARQDRYQMRTPLATVGIRGTTYSLVHCQRDCIADDGS